MEAVNGVEVLPDRTVSTTKPATESAESVAARPPSILTGRQEHYLKRELVHQQVHHEIQELSSPTALQRFGAPFRSEYGEVAPVDSDLPILRYIFVHHVRHFPFLDKAREKEFWQDKLQVFLESFAKKHISSSEDRLEETKRRKLATKCEKVVELMMVSGIPTASGYEERIRFSEMEVVERGANEQGLLVNAPDGHEINGWDVNVAGVRTTSVKRTVRYHSHAEFILRVKPKGKDAFFIGRRYGDFSRLLKSLPTELPGKVLAPLPRKIKTSTTSNFLSVGGGDDDDSSVSSVSTHDTAAEDGRSLRSYMGGGQRRSASANPSSRGSSETRREPAVLYRAEQRVSLRAFLRTLLQNPQVARTKSIRDFLTGNPVQLNEEELADIERRKEMDQRRIEEQEKFYEIARQRAKELDVYMERFRRDIIESNGLTKLFREIREKETLEDLSVQYKKFAEWLRIEVAATVYHLFLAEDNSPELFAQAKRIHSLIPYTLIKNVIRIANPAMVVTGVIDLFMAQPFGSRSLMQRIFSMTLNDGIRSFQKSIDSLVVKINDPVLCSKLKHFTDADETTKNELREEAAQESTDLIVVILRSDLFKPELTPSQIERVFNAYVAWNNAVENVDAEMKAGAQLFAYLKQLLKLYTRQRDKAMMLSMVEEPVTLQLFKDLFLIFYEPLIRVYKSANVYNSVTDYAVFMDDMIQVVERAQRQDASADPNQTVQAFIDLCQRHEHNFYKFVHEVHIHDNGLFEQLMGWLEDILHFLRNGPKGGKLDMNLLFQGAVESKEIDREKATAEINSLIKWHEARKQWHQDKTRQKMAAEGTGTAEKSSGMMNMNMNSFRSSDFGLNESDIQDMNMDEEDDEESEAEAEVQDELDPIAAERRRRAKKRDLLRRSAGEPIKPEVEEVLKLRGGFLMMLRNVLAD
ncbi:MAG: T-complex protein 1 subunit delta [Watsoniomyces obsoletus]|nr:MAG: T-complex protein 1 subunit delta [Watsoniomyces obsoletus]